MILKFGKYKNLPLEDVPSDYLLWLGCLKDLRQPLLGAVLKEMGRRLVALDQPEERGDQPPYIGPEAQRGGR